MSAPVVAGVLLLCVSSSVAAAMMGGGDSGSSGSGSTGQATTPVTTAAPVTTPGPTAAATAPSTLSPDSSDVTGYTKFDNLTTDSGEEQCLVDSSLNACKTRCDYTDDCISFTFSEDKTCCINNEVSGISFDSKIKTYVRTPEGYSVEKLGDKSGGTLSNFQTLNFTQCIDTCKDTEECVGISYKAGACELKQADGLASGYSDTTKQFIKNNNPKTKSPTTPAIVSTCVGGTVCPSKLTSTSGACVAVTQGDGNYVVYNSGTVIWDSKTTGRGTGPYRTTMQSDGNLVLYDSTNTALWDSKTAGRGTGPYKAVMQDDCNLVVYDSSSLPTWSSIGGLVPVSTCVGGTVCPSKLTSTSGACVAVTQDDGNYVVYDSTGTAIWDSKTTGRGTGPYRTTMQSDGNLVLYDSTNTALWDSKTTGRGTGPYRAVMQDDCNFVIYDSSSLPTWSSIGGIVP